MATFIEVKSGEFKRLVNIEAIEVVFPEGDANGESAIQTKNRYFNVSETYEEIKKKIEEVQSINIEVQK